MVSHTSIIEVVEVRGFPLEGESLDHTRDMIKNPKSMLIRIIKEQRHELIKGDIFPREPDVVSTERTSPTPRLPNTSITPNEVQVGGRLSRFASAWKKNSWAYNVVKRGIKWRWSFHQPRLRFLRGQPSRPVFLEYV